MSKKQKEKPVTDGFENVENALSKTEQFIEDNQKILSIVAFALIAVVGGYWALTKLYFQPLEVEAQNSIYAAQDYFEKDSFNLALNGDGNSLGFLDVMDEYGSTKPGKLARYYAGISYLHLGDFEEAIDYLEGFSTEDDMLMATTHGAMGDAYWELGETDEAEDCYKKAIQVKNEITAPTYLMKLGMLYEAADKYAQAAEMYKVIKDEYKNSNEARQIDKYITRAELHK
jgi:tetratricopeptide (TPR) repeat protein